MVQHVPRQQQPVMQHPMPRAGYSVYQHGATYQPYPQLLPGHPAMYGTYGNAQRQYPYSPRFLPHLNVESGYSAPSSPLQFGSDETQQSWSKFDDLLSDQQIDPALFLDDLKSDLNCINPQDARVETFPEINQDSIKVDDASTAAVVPLNNVVKVVDEGLDALNANSLDQSGSHFADLHSGQQGIISSFDQSPGEVVKKEFDNHVDLIAFV